MHPLYMHIALHIFKLILLLCRPCHHSGENASALGRIFAKKLHNQNDIIAKTWYLNLRRQKCLGTEKRKLGLKEMQNTNVRTNHRYHLLQCSIL